MGAERKRTTTKRSTWRDLIKQKKEEVVEAEEQIRIGQCATCKEGRFRLRVERGIWTRTCIACHHEERV